MKNSSVEFGDMTSQCAKPNITYPVDPNIVINLNNGGPNLHHRRMINVRFVFYALIANKSMSPFTYITATHPLKRLLDVHTNLETNIFMMKLH